MAEEYFSGTVLQAPVTRYDDEVIPERTGMFVAPVPREGGGTGLLVGTIHPESGNGILHLAELTPDEADQLAEQILVAASAARSATKIPRSLVKVVQ
ncbi:hypothetical protein B5C34_05310 [Pacificimonas flava]|uniref:Uncharacterized protein n=2 Tax=Pacificimonas TaxID=1960290 RepID=A0A219B3K1_9SPHN|nr:MULTISPECIES: hypothetical protein [Pacificimonas]MBZ6377362.1 hypothetical protein [Pacificimonas aurantium]OWV32930.1 hypothetical protein B5C34_05310 [Pacificimonas flava]